MARCSQASLSAAALRHRGCWPRCPRGPRCPGCRSGGHYGPWCRSPRGGSGRAGPHHAWPPRASRRGPPALAALSLRWSPGRCARSPCTTHATPSSPRTCNYRMPSVASSAPGALWYGRCRPGHASCCPSRCATVMACRRLTPSALQGRGGCRARLLEAAGGHGSASSASHGATLVVATAASSAAAVLADRRLTSERPGAMAR